MISNAMSCSKFWLSRGEYQLASEVLYVSDFKTCDLECLEKQSTAIDSHIARYSSDQNKAAYFKCVYTEEVIDQIKEAIDDPISFRDEMELSYLNRLYFEISDIKQNQNSPWFPTKNDHTSQKKRRYFEDDRLDEKSFASGKPINNHSKRPRPNSDFIASSENSNVSHRKGPPPATRKLFGMVDLFNKISQSSNGSNLNIFLPEINSNDPEEFLSGLEMIARISPYHIIDQSPVFDSNQSVDSFCFYLKSKESEKFPLLKTYLSKRQTITISKDNYLQITECLSQLDLTDQVQIEWINIQMRRDLSSFFARILPTIKSLIRKYNIKLRVKTSNYAQIESYLSVATELELLLYEDTYDIFQKEYLDKYPNIQSYVLKVTSNHVNLSTYYQEKKPNIAIDIDQYRYTDAQYLPMIRYIDRCKRSDLNTAYISKCIKIYDEINDFTDMPDDITYLWTSNGRLDNRFRNIKELRYDGSNISDIHTVSNFKSLEMVTIKDDMVDLTSMDQYKSLETLTLYTISTKFPSVISGNISCISGYIYTIIEEDIILDIPVIRLDNIIDVKSLEYLKFSKRIRKVTINRRVIGEDDLILIKEFLVRVRRISWIEEIDVTYNEVKVPLEKRGIGLKGFEEIVVDDIRNIKYRK
jgi:hypothetical protein